MKLVTYTRTGDPQQHLGAVTPDGLGVVNLQQASQLVDGEPWAAFRDMLAFLAGGAEARAVAARLLASAPGACLSPLSSVTLLAPVPRPLTLRDCACYEAHLVNVKRTALLMGGRAPASITPEELKPPPAWYQAPLFYKGNVNAVVGPEAAVAFPEGERFKDYELELAVYIGKEGININARDAMEHVGGYTILNDFSARTTQLKEMDPAFHLGPALGKDFAYAMGPWLVTPDEFDPTDATMVVRVNGEERGRGNSGSAYHSLEEVIEYASNNTTLYPGDVIATGTVGLGAGIEIGRPLKIGDEVELEIAGLGVLRNRVVPPKMAKVRNRLGIYKRSVCATVNGTSDFVIEDHADITRARFTDLWKVEEMPVARSASTEVDLGNEPFSHEAPLNGSVLRYVELNPMVRGLPKLSSLPPPLRQQMVEMAQDLHREIGTHSIPQEQDLMKDLTMHRTDSVNLFVCLDGDYQAINDQDEISLKPGDVFIQLGSMHAHGYRGDAPAHIGGLLVDADPRTATQLTALPTPAGTSTLKRFKRYVCGTVKSQNKATGESRVILDDYSPNETELRDGQGRLLGYAGEMWRTSAPRADASGARDPVEGPLEHVPPRGGVSLRMVELLPGARLEMSPRFVQYYSVTRGILTAISEKKTVEAKASEHLVQLKARMTLENRGDGPTVFAHFLLDTAP